MVLGVVVRITSRTKSRGYCTRFVPCDCGFPLFHFEFMRKTRHLQMCNGKIVTRCSFGVVLTLDVCSHIQRTKLGSPSVCLVHGSFTRSLSREVKLTTGTKQTNSKEEEMLISSCGRSCADWTTSTWPRFPRAKLVLAAKLSPRRIDAVFTKDTVHKECKAVYDSSALRVDEIVPPEAHVLHKYPECIATSDPKL